MVLDPVLLGWLAVASFIVGLVRMGLALKGYQNKPLGNVLLAVSALAAASVISLVLWARAGLVLGASYSWAPWVAAAALVLLVAPWFWKTIAKLQAARRSRAAKPEPSPEPQITTGRLPGRPPARPVARRSERCPERIAETGGAYSTRGKQVYDSKGLPVGGPHPSRSGAKRAAYQLAHPDVMQRKYRQRWEAGYQLLVHRGCHLYDWFEPESSAYATHRKQYWLTLGEMGKDALWAFAERNVLPLIFHDDDEKAEAWDVLQKDPEAFRVWIVRKLTGVR